MKRKYNCRQLLACGAPAVLSVRRQGFCGRKITYDPVVKQSTRVYAQGGYVKVVPAILELLSTEGLRL